MFGFEGIRFVYYFVLCLLVFNGLCIRFIVFYVYNIDLLFFSKNKKEINLFFILLTFRMLLVVNNMV